MKNILALLVTMVLAVSTEAVDKSVYDLIINKIDGKPQKLSDYKGKVLLIVNTASQCGFTPQLKDLEELQEKYGSRGFQVLAFPSNDFNQDKGTAEETDKFAKENYKITFPLFDKGIVKGEKKQELYKILTEAKPGFLKEVQWNFEKFIVDRKGQVVERYRSTTKPSDKEVVALIEKLLIEK